MEQARDEMLAMFNEAWTTQSAAVAGYVPEVAWEEDDSGEDRPQDRAWARAIVRHTGSAQATIGRVGERRFEREGQVLVQVFAPRGAEGVTLSTALGKIAADAFEGKHSPGGIWFRAVSVQEVGPDGPWFQVNMTAAFLYDELK